MNEWPHQWVNFIECKKHVWFGFKCLDFERLKVVAPVAAAVTPQAGSGAIRVRSKSGRRGAGAIGSIEEWGSNRQAPKQTISVALWSC
jgi:hypothetical protein